jgi:hypothetical protein
MSSHHYKQRLQDVLVKLSHQTIVANEWKTVATNRSTLLCQVDSALDSQVKGLLQVGSIFGVDPTDPKIPRANSGQHTGDEMCLMILAKVEAVSHFIANLTREATATQAILNSTLEIAMEAVEVERPTVDLIITPNSSDFTNASSPILEVVRQIESSPSEPEDMDSEGADHEDTVMQNSLVRKRNLTDHLFT